MNRDRDFKCITQNAGKGKRVGSRSLQDVDWKVHHNKENIEHKLRDYNKMHFSKVKGSIAYKDKLILI